MSGILDAHGKYGLAELPAVSDRSSEKLLFSVAD